MFLCVCVCVCVWKRGAAGEKTQHRPIRVDFDVSVKRAGSLRNLVLRGTGGGGGGSELGSVIVMDVNNLINEHTTRRREQIAPKTEEGNRIATSSGRLSEIGRAAGRGRG